MLWLAAGFFALLALLATRVVVGLWRNEAGAWDAKPLWWRRSIPTIVVVAWAMLIGAVVSPLAMSESGIVGAIFTAVLVISLFAFVFGFILWATVAATGWPRPLIPPHLRR